LLVCLLARLHTCARTCLTGCLSGDMVVCPFGQAETANHAHAHSQGLGGHRPERGRRKTTRQGKTVVVVIAGFHCYCLRRIVTITVVNTMPAKS